MNGRRHRWARALGQAALAAGIFGVAAFLKYAYNNGSGHTGAPFSHALAYFAAVSAGGACDVAFNRAHARTGALAAFLGGAGLCIVLYFDRVGILREYQRWIRAGMPAAHPEAQAIVVSAGALVLLGTLALWATWPIRPGRADS